MQFSLEEHGALDGGVHGPIDQEDLEKIFVIDESQDAFEKFGDVEDASTRAARSSSFIEEVGGCDLGEECLETFSALCDLGADLAESRLLVEIILGGGLIDEGVELFCGSLQTGLER